MLVRDILEILTLSFAERGRRLLWIVGEDLKVFRNFYCYLISHLVRSIRKLQSAKKSKIIKIYGNHAALYSRGGLDRLQNYSSDLKPDMTKLYKIGKVFS